MPTNTATPKTGTCFCGAETSGYHSGRWECQECWDWRKLDGPAARHWSKVATEFLSNVDCYDLFTYFAKCGISSDEAKTMLESALKLRNASVEMIAEHRF